MTYEELQAFGALAGWPRCQGPYPHSGEPCNRFCNPGWENSYTHHLYCPVDADVSREPALRCDKMTDEQWMQRLQTQLGIKL
jgi:hypothetical protein